MGGWKWKREWKKGEEYIYDKNRFYFYTKNDGKQNIPQLYNPNYIIENYIIEKYIIEKEIKNRQMSISSEKSLDNIQEKETETEKEKLFTEREYGSKDGMLTTVWGPGIWHFLHTISFNYPIYPTAKDKKHYRDFILQLRYVLPCGKCRENLVKNLKRLPLRTSDLENRDSFSRYIYQLHELINTMLHKTSGLSYEQVRERYEHFRARCNRNSTMKKSGNGGRNKTEKKFGKNVGKRGKKKELGCTEPLYKGEKAKCVLKIIPQKEKCETIQIDEQCLKKKD